MTPRLDAIGLVVADLDRSLAFYRQLGLDLPDQVDAPHVEADLGGGIRLMWDTHEVVRSMHPDWTPAPAGEGIGLAVSCGSPAEVDALHAQLVADGATSGLDPFDAPWGQRYAQLLDPDGHSVDLYAALA
jgi:catechol 2,3-dioxygenase-like lactoylglutathione lyase family enzyme